ncbi:hypothetical protein ACFW0I_32215 [[Kitasatospora] papulosa]|uniref:hypothetical protein n=1 Tax=[Kitasatospora] papulosa TaxID=1464011 RepID=UPI00368F726A
MSASTFGPWRCFPTLCRLWPPTPRAGPWASICRPAAWWTPRSTARGTIPSAGAATNRPRAGPGGRAPHTWSHDADYVAVLIAAEIAALVLGFLVELPVSIAMALFG